MAKSERRKREKALSNLRKHNLTKITWGQDNLNQQDVLTVYLSALEVAYMVRVNVIKTGHHDPWQ